MSATEHAAHPGARARPRWQRGKRHRARHRKRPGSPGGHSCPVIRGPTYCRRRRAEIGGRGVWLGVCDRYRYRRRGHCCQRHAAQHATARSGRTGMFGYVTSVVVRYFHQSLGVPGALAITGVLILGSAAVTARLMRVDARRNLKNRRSERRHPAQAPRARHGEAITSASSQSLVGQAEPPCASGDSRCWEDRPYGMSVISLARAAGAGRLANPDAGDREPLHRRDVAAGVHHDGDHLAGCGVERNSE